MEELREIDKSADDELDEIDDKTANQIDLKTIKGLKGRILNADRKIWAENESIQKGQTMDISKVLTEIILLERGIKDLYADMAANTDNTESARMLRLLSRESEYHAQQLESRYDIKVKRESIDEGVAGLLSLISETINKIREKTSLTEILQEGIEIEGYMEKFYRELAANYKLDENLDKSLKRKEEASKISNLLIHIAADERNHQDMLKKYMSKIAKAERT